MSAPGRAPDYKGEPLDAARGPGLGCFWLQVIVLAVLLVLTPLTVMWAWDPAVSAILLFLTLGALFFAGQTVIFLLRLVSADRRARRRPLDPGARRTVGQLEDDMPAGGPAPVQPEEPAPVQPGEPAADRPADPAQPGDAKRT